MRSEQSTEPLYIGYIQLPVRHCRLRFVLEEEERAAREKDIPVWAFAILLAVLAGLIGACGVVLLMPYGGICQ